MKSVTLVRRIAARPSIVFDAMTTPEGVAAWWGPDDGPVLRADVDARVGGRYRVRFRRLGGDEHEACGDYLEFAPPHRIVMSWRWSFGGEPDEEGRTSRIEIDLSPVGAGTEVTLTHADLANEVSEKSHEQGWTGSLEKLVRYLKSAPAAAHLEE